MWISAEEEWEGELEAELKDFEVVPGKNATAESVDATGKDDWEEQMDELLGEDEDLKWRSALR